MRWKEGMVPRRWHWSRSLLNRGVGRTLQAGGAGMERSRREGGQILWACRGCVWEGRGRGKSVRGLARQVLMCPPHGGEPTEVLRFKGELEQSEVKAEKVAWRPVPPHKGLGQRV